MVNNVAIGVISFTVDVDAACIGDDIVSVFKRVEIEDS